MNRLLVLSLALASIFGVNAKQVGTVAAATVSEAEVVAPMSQLVPEVKAADPAREIAFGYAKAQAKAAGLKEVTGPAKAFYTRQKGMTYTGMSANSSSLESSYMHILLNQDFTLKSLSTEDETLTWTISDGFTYDEEGNVIGYTFRDISGETVTWHYDELSSEIYCPILKASNSLGESTYQVADYLCTLPKITSTTEGVGDFYKTNVNPTADIVAYWGVSACNSEDANARLVSNYGLSEDKGFTDVNLYGLGEVFYYPGKPYLLTDVAAFVCDLVRDGNLKANLEIYKVSFDEEDNMEIGDLLTTATNDPSFIVSGRQFQCVVFNKLESESGETLIINSDIVVVVKPADTSTSYASYIYATIEDYPAQVSDLWNDFPSAYLLAGAKYNGNDVVIPISGAAAFYHGDAKTKLDVQRAFHIDINTTYCDDVNLSTDLFNVPITGGVKTISATAQFPSSEWTVKTDDGYDIPEWITIKFDDKYDTNNNYIGVTDIEIEVAPILDGINRECNINFYYLMPSDKPNILIQQGEGPTEPLNFEVNGIYYKKNYDGTSVSVTYKGDAYDAYENEYVGDIIIPSTIVYEKQTYDVNKIGKYAFYGCKDLTNVTIPNSINSIDSYSFYNCTKLTNLILPNSITQIGSFAFYGCNSLYEINIPFRVSNIGSKAFYNCKGLKVINYDSNNCNCTDIFNQGISPESIIIGENVTLIPNKLFLAVTPKRVISKSITSPVCSESTFNESTYNKVLYTPSEGDFNYQFDEIWSKFSIINTLDKQITDIKLNINEATIKPGNSITLNAKVTPVEATIPAAIYWTSNDPEVATVNQDGLVTAIAEGNAIITAKSCDCGEALATCNVIVKSYKATSITLNFKELSIFERRETATIKYTILPEDATTKSAEWIISDDTILQYKINSDGTISIEGKSVGTATVTARTTDGTNLEATCNVTVKPYIATSITLNYTELSIFEKTETATLKYTILPEDISIKTAEWVISDESVIQYKKNTDGSLLIGGKSAGTATVTARTTDGSNLEATCVVTVNPVATNVNQIKPGTNKVKFALQGVKMHDGVLYACTTTESVNKSTPTFHGNDANNMAPYEDRNFADFDQRDWVAISGLEGDFEGKELSYPFVATFADGVLTPSGTITATADATAYTLNTFRAENILHGGYSNYAEGDYKAYYVPAKENEVAKFMGLIETVGGVKYLYSNNAYGRKDGEGIKVEGTIEDNSKVYSLLEGILVADKSTKAGVKIIMLKDLGQATGVEGVDSAAARIYSANGNIIIAATEDGEAAVYDYTGRLIKSVPVVAGDNTAVPVIPGCYIVRTGVKTQSVVVK